MYCVPSFVLQRSAATRSRLSDRDKKLLLQTYSKLSLLLCHRPPKPESAVLPLIREYLQTCPWPSECLAIHQDRGNLLQLAVINNYPDVAEYFISLGAEVNAVGCGCPLHLACKLGHVEMVQRLLMLNADPTLLSTVCYPHEHTKDKFMYDPSLDTVNVVCALQIHDSRGFDVPLAYALQSDSVECVKVLGEQQVGLHCGLTPLGFACDVGAVKCVSYLSKLQPSQVNEVDDHGLLPIHYAIKWGRPMIETLVFSGASVLAKTPQHNTLLHLLLGDGNHNKQLSQSAEFLLNCGLNMNVNTLNMDGQTALHRLMLRLRKTSDKQLQAELIQTLQLLLQARANPNIGCRVGMRPVQILLTSNPCIVSFQTTKEVLRLLLKYGVNLNLASQDKATVSELFLKVASKWILTSRLQSEQLPQFSQTLDLICRNSRGLSSIRDKVCHLYIVLSYARPLADSNISMYGSYYNHTQVHGYLITLLAVMRALIQCSCQMAGCQSHAGYVYDFCGWVLKEGQTLPYPDFHAAVLLLLENPSLQRSRDTPYKPQLQHVSKHILDRLRNPSLSSPCFYSVTELLQLLLVFLCHQGPRHIKDFLRDQVLRSDTDSWPPSQQYIQQFLIQVARSPVSLKHAAADTIYRQLGRRLHLIDSLPLPKEIKQYLSNLVYVGIPSWYKGFYSWRNLGPGFWKKFLLKSMLVTKYFLTSFLIGWQLCCAAMFENSC